VGEASEEAINTLAKQLFYTTLARYGTHSTDSTDGQYMWTVLDGQCRVTIWTDTPGDCTE